MFTTRSGGFVTQGVRRMLAIDGGGLKGALPAALLAEIEERSGQKIVDQFDLIAGTSTGGIIALGLAMGLPAREILEFYLKDGKRIFPTGLFSRSYRSARRWLLPQFTSHRLRAALQARLGAHRLL